MAMSASLAAIQKSIWDGRIPLEINLAPSESRTYDKTDPYLVRFYRPYENMVLTFIGGLFPGCLSSLIAPKAAGLFRILSDRA